MTIDSLSIQYPPTWQPEQPISTLWEQLCDQESVVVVREDGSLQGLLDPEVVMPDERMMPQSWIELEADVLTLPVVYAKDHLFMAARMLKLAEDGKLAVLESDQRFLGLIDAEAVRDRILEGLNLEMETGVILVEMMAVDLSLSKIVQIVEQEGVKILGITVHRPASDEHPFFVSIKLNTPETMRAVASLKRFEFVVHDFHSQGSLSDDMRNRVEELMHFLSI